MPDRLKDIYDTLEEIQTGGGLGGGGGTTDVSALAKELTLATVVTNTAATTVAIGTLETNVITASGVQTLSLNSATSAQTTTLGTAIGATNTALGTVNTNLGSVITKLTADALVQTDILGNGLDILTETTNVLTELQGLKTSVDADALIQANTNTLIDNMDSNLHTVAAYAPNLESINTATTASADSLVEVSTKLDTLNTSVSSDYTLQGQLLDATLDYGTVVDVIRVMLEEVIPAVEQTQTSVSGSTTSVTLVAANPSRRSLTLFNNSNSHLFICAGATATQAGAICRIDPYGYYEMPTPRYLGVLSGIWESANGNASIYEGV